MDDAEGEDDERDPQAPPAWASFNMNYFRPHFFGNEAAIELEDFAARFGRSVCDPQIDGMGDPGELSKGAFLEGWNSGNKLAYGLMAEQGMSAPLRPAAELERIWPVELRSRTSAGGAGAECVRAAHLVLRGRRHAGECPVSGQTRYQRCYQMFFSGSVLHQQDVVPLHDPRSGKLKNSLT